MNLLTPYNRVAIVTAYLALLFHPASVKVVQNSALASLLEKEKAKFWSVLVNAKGLPLVGGGCQRTPLPLVGQYSPPSTDDLLSSKFKCNM